MNYFAAVYFACGIGVVVHNLNTLSCTKCHPDWHGAPTWARLAFCFATWLVWPIAAGVDIIGWARGTSHRDSHDDGDHQ